MNLLEQDPQPSTPEYRTIPLTQGQVALIDAEDYESMVVFKWRAWWNKCTKSYYAIRNRSLIDGPRATIYMHRQIMGFPPNVVDHENRQTLDNRRLNLRNATHSQNHANTGLCVRNTSGFRGVSFCKRTGLWQTKLKVDGKFIWLGRHATKEEAGRTARNAMEKYHGEFFYRDGGTPSVDLKGATPGP